MAKGQGNQGFQAQTIGQGDGGQVPTGLVGGPPHGMPGTGQGGVTAGGNTPLYPTGQQAQGGQPLFIGGNCVLFLDGRDLIVRIPTDGMLKAASSGKSILVGSIGKTQIVVNGIPYAFNVNLYRDPLTPDEAQLCQNAAIRAVPR